MDGVEYVNLDASGSHVYTNLEPHIYANVWRGGRRPDESAASASVSAACGPSWPAEALSNRSLVLSFENVSVPLPLASTATRQPTPPPPANGSAQAVALAGRTPPIAQSNVVPSMRLAPIVQRAPVQFFSLSLPPTPNPVQWRRRCMSATWAQLNRLLQVDYTFWALRTLHCAATPSRGVQ